jgi:Uma2 family endonuclease
VAIQLTPRRFTATEYHQMIEAGVFGQDERLELIDGEIVQLSPLLEHLACRCRPSSADHGRSGPR